MRKLYFFISIIFMIAMANLLFAQIGNEYIRINGYFSFEFEYLLGDEGKGDPNGSFDSDLIDLVFNIMPTENLRIATDLTWEHGAATEDGRGNVAIEYAFGEYTVKDWFKVRAGKVFTPFGIYNEIHTAKPAFYTVKEPLSTNKNHKFGSDLRFYPRWLTGLGVLGNFNSGEMDGDYILLIANGEQENTNPFEEDDNKEKAYAGRVRISPISNLKVGLSFYSDQLTELDTLGEDSENRTAQLSYGGQVEWIINDLGLELEYVAGTIKPTGEKTISRAAYTAMFFYTFIERLTPYLRYEYLDPDKDINDDEANMLVYGLNAKITEGLFLKAEINTVSSGDINKRFKGVGYSEFKAAVAIGF